VFRKPHRRFALSYTRLINLITDSLRPHNSSGVRATFSCLASLCVLACVEAFFLKSVGVLGSGCQAALSGLQDPSQPTHRSGPGYSDCSRVATTVTLLFALLANLSQRKFHDSSGTVLHGRAVFSPLYHFESVNAKRRHAENKRNGGRLSPGSTG